MSLLGPVPPIETVFKNKINGWQVSEYNKLVLNRMLRIAILDFFSKFTYLFSNLTLMVNKQVDALCPGRHQGN